MRVSRAAATLGVDHELLQGLVAGGIVAGWTSTGRTGQPVWFVYTDELRRLQREMGL